MAEKRITYKSIGFTLGLGGKGSRTVAPKAASSFFLDTLISSVPSAKAMLPNIAPGLLKPTAAEGSKGTGQLNEGLPSAVLQSTAGGRGETAREEIPSLKPTSRQLRSEQQQPTENSTPRAPEPAITIISLLTDSESCTPQEAIPKPTQATATSPERPDVGGKGTGTKPSSAEFIPVPLATTHGPTNPVKTAAPGSADELAEQENIRRLGERPYWMSYISRITSPLLRLHQELLELCELVQPTPDEAAARQEAVAAVSEVVRSIWPQAKCEIFGSYATGLYVPTSDIDLVILDSGCTNVQYGLKALANALNSRKVAQNIQVVGKARVPIVKFESVGYGNLAFDVSFDVANGPQAAMLVSEMTATWPMMRPLILSLKLFLQQRELNEVYTGGIGSYALVTLVASFLQLHGSRRPKAGPVGSQQEMPPPVYGTSGDAAMSSLSGGVEPGLGMLLVDFFRFYGRVLNVNDVGVSCAAGGQFFRKVDKEPPKDVRGAYDGWLNEDRANLLSVEDPKDPDNDICRNSFNITRVKVAFEFAYQMLTAPSLPDESLLSRILRLGPILASRPRPAVPHLRELGYYTEAPSKENQLDRGYEQRREQRNDRKQQETPGGQGRKDGGHGNTPDGSHGAGSSRKKRAREKSTGGDGDGLGAKQGGKAGKARGQPAEGGRTALTEPLSTEPKMQRKQQLREERKAKKQRKATKKTDAQPNAGGGEGGGGGGGRRAAPKRRREEPTPSRGTAAGNATPARSAKRPRTDGQAPQQQQKSKRQQQQQQQNAQQNRRKSRDGGNRPLQQQQQHKQEVQQIHHLSNRQQQPNQHHQSQAQQQRRPALMQVTVQQSAPAPLFHPGYATPSTNQDHHRHHSSQHHHSQQHPSNRGGGGGGSSNNGQQHHHNHHSHDSHQHRQSYNRQDGGYYGSDGRRDDYDGNGGSGQGMYSQGLPPTQQREWERARAPLTLTPRHQHRQQLQQQRGQHQHQYAQRMHTFYD